MDGARSKRLKQRRREEYDAKDKEVKRSAREDKRNWLEKRAAAAEKAAENGRNKELYSITKTIARERRRQEASSVQLLMEARHQNGLRSSLE